MANERNERERDNLGFGPKDEIPEFETQSQIRIGTEWSNVHKIKGVKKIISKSLHNMKSRK